jgi:hypothetical protein
MTSATPSPPSSWLMLLHQLPAEPPGLRVRIWRRLQTIGALSLKNAVYLLPDSESAREDFAWIAEEVRAAGAEAVLWRASAVDGIEDAGLVQRFRDAATAEYEALEEEIRAELAPHRGKRARAAVDPRTVARWRNLFHDAGQRDFFGAPRREVVGALLDTLETAEDASMSAADSAPPALATGDYRGKTWVTRAGVKIDRLASAWLIRRHIDPEARFRFAQGRSHAPGPDELRFDMYEGEFTHVGERCTFEMLVARFGLSAPGLAKLAEIVHDIDLKDGRHGHPETAGVAAVVDGIVAHEPDDMRRIERASAVFDGLIARLGGG